MSKVRIAGWRAGRPIDGYAAVVPARKFKAGHTIAVLIQHATGFDLHDTGSKVQAEARTYIDLNHDGLRTSPNPCAGFAGCSANGWIGKYRPSSRAVAPEWLNSVEEVFNNPVGERFMKLAGGVQNPIHDRLDNLVTRSVAWLEALPDSHQPEDEVPVMARL